ncbi:hypothetical protein ACLESO_55620 [Pyxidicoccus sp. 3LG]
MTRVAALLATALLCACGASTTLPTPEILSVSPNRVTVPRHVSAEKRDTVKISLDAVIPIRVDYDDERARAEASRVWIGAEEAEVLSLVADGTLTVSVPEALDEGTYDIRVALADGREARRPDALTLRRPGTNSTVDSPDAGLDPISLDGGTGEDAGTPVDPRSPMREGDITGYDVSIDNFQEESPTFILVVTAQGQRAAHFQGTVQLSINKQNASVTPASLGPFSNGRLSKPVTVDGKGGNLKLTVTDEFGAQGTSAGFKLKE